MKALIKDYLKALKYLAVGFLVLQIFIQLLTVFL